MDRERAIKAVEELLLAIGEDINREGIKETPRRVADMFAELTSGKLQTATEHLSKTFFVYSGEMVFEKDLVF